MTDTRKLTERAFFRAAGAPLIEGNDVRLLKDAAENYPAWLEAIGAARRHIHFESYIIHDDETGCRFADALIAKAAEGVRVRLIYDWMGGFGKTSRRFWERLRAGGVEVRGYNPPRLDRPLGWLSRDHRKMLAVDGRIGFITGLCVGRMWVGIPKKGIAPWRDTGIEVRGPAVGDIERAFARVWSMMGEPIPEGEIAAEDSAGKAGEVSLRVIATVPVTTSMYRLDQIIAAIVKKRLWLTDAYYGGIPSYVQSLRAAAKDGVDVRLLVPNATDLPIMRPLSRAGYRTLLEAGVRVFEWNGTMLHAKTAVADGRLARVGSTNLNFFGWFGNCELDAFIEDERFASAMEEMYLQDLANSTEVVLDAKMKVRSPGAPSHHGQGMMSSGGGSGGRMAAGAIRIGNAVGAAFTDRRTLEPIEARLMTVVGAMLLVFAAFFVSFPRVPAYLLFILFAWGGFALLYRGAALSREKRRRKRLPENPQDASSPRSSPMKDKDIN
ncbi:MAG: phospholipase D-like domain-containing protein [Acidobacteriota bacterium]|nr:phospholipase D-like domain-containing protein [Acidobacteriota bacterium]